MAASNGNNPNFESPDLERSSSRAAEEQFVLVYLYPVDVEAYASRMLKRFKHEKENGIRSLSIWPEVTPQVEEAYDSIELNQFMQRMARQSMTRSAQRYGYFEENGLDMVRVDV
ncbi:uncharacterized protein PITG_06506 [Phytophthora infestans T30-4]|uniref:Uncharacterized protein n=1 Tax=Phytophthora infestans (strain T30-4) TaxID=403677 RepID=D0N504_PHYIT|nr:uncharacterized protein PITG_06506 [Phytophthora infestans T30-4]EEY69962.1 conserved hypothetical protein [Phytophthora infestans T30-4]|eukprot:XP_002998609.1 conserved hypothetical protein [Phytophthora infestans T30-4]